MTHCPSCGTSVDPAATPMLARRSARAETLEEQLFAFAMLGDDRAISDVYVMGEPAGA